MVGTNDAGAVLVFRIGGAYGFEVSTPPAAAHEFVSAGKAGLFTSTVNAEPLNTAAYEWRDGRSPLTVHVMLLPPIHVEIAETAFDALTTYLKENSGRLGPLTLPETPMDRMLREYRERGPRVEMTPEEADKALVARNPDLRATDVACQGLHMDAARKAHRITCRREGRGEEAPGRCCH